MSDDSEHRVVTHRTSSLFRKGPTVRDMCRVIRTLGKASDSLHPTNVRVYARAKFPICDANFFQQRSFRDEASLADYYADHQEPVYIPKTQSEIEWLVNGTHEARAMVESNGGTYPLQPAVQLVDLTDKCGSYIRFEDELIRGSVDYIHHPVNLKDYYYSVGKTLVGSVPTASLAYYVYYKLTGGGSIGPLTSILVIGGGLLGLAAIVDGIRGTAFCDKKYLETTITPKTDSGVALGRADELVNILKEQYS